ncbi:hypothetical protein PS662_06109 [Pseudomonas fluorescens]|uniref:Uncharacterized protein n=1 Tax=Pseudomonas fluorescens TaxID=294 RepID=A0A5E6Y6C4_PSEFL|nr:hypothetical protein PS662_06109 [Pseudomonas fluorescens]
MTAQILTQTQADFAQQLIAHVMPERIIDRFETVQIDEHQGKTAALLLHPRHRLINAVGQQYPIRQAGQGIVQRQLGEFAIGFGQGLGQLRGASLEPCIEHRRQQGNAQHRQCGDQHQTVQALAAQTIDGRATETAVRKTRGRHGGVVHADDGDAHDHCRTRPDQTDVRRVSAQAEGNP